jgi:pimeloyl-ACP methyl ester carboxylesterase
MIGGGIVAWACAMVHPDRIDRLAILYAPRPSVFWNYMRTQPAQVLRSYYMFFMQPPWLPEFLFKAANFRAMTAALTRIEAARGAVRTGYVRTMAYVHRRAPPCRGRLCDYIVRQEAAALADENARTQSALRTANEAVLCRTEELNVELEWQGS